MFWVFFGLTLVLAYWYSVHPLGFGRGYIEDWCHLEMTRQMAAEGIAQTGSPQFFSSSVMAPHGLSLPFMAWGVETAWLGSVFWKWNRDFPFYWALYGVSLTFTFLGVGWILRRMKLSVPVAWSIALVFVLFNVPRHYKTWHHFEHMIAHWMYLSFFFDAWVWQRFWRERRWSWSLDFWRLFLLVAMLETAGYYWGPLILEFVLVRACMLWFAHKRRKQGIQTQIEGHLSQAAVPAVLGLAMLLNDLRWYWPLLKEARGFGAVDQGMGWFTPLQYVPRPLWWDHFTNLFNRVTGLPWKMYPVNHPETAATVGWLLWIPALLGLRQVRKKFGGQGLQTAWPFVVFLAGALWYMTFEPTYFQDLLCLVVPFLKFFRVAGRMALFIPPLLGVIVALCWPELSKWLKEGFARKDRKFYVWAALFAISSGAELEHLGAKTTLLPAVEPEMLRLLHNVKESPGDTVLDLPFCMAGGNAVCTWLTCPGYPATTVGHCLRQWHDKRVYGIYAARLKDSQCDVYRAQPFSSWFTSWHQQRCFTEDDWKGFCSYLSENPRHAAVLVYPDLWAGWERTGCRAQFEAQLGPAVEEARIAVSPYQFGDEPRFTRVLRYPGQCR